MSQPSLSAADIVSVFRYRRGLSRAECTCGWESKDRRRRGRAVFDALMHAAQTGCRENWRLVYDERRPRPSLLMPLGWLGAAAAIIGAALYCSVPADADPISDVAYLSTLDNYKIPYSSESAAITEGYGVCQLLDNAFTLVDVMRYEIRVKGRTADDAGHLIGASIGAYCDEHSDLVDPKASMGGRI